MEVRCVVVVELTAEDRDRLDRLLDASEASTGIEKITAEALVKELRALSRRLEVLREELNPL